MKTLFSFVFILCALASCTVNRVDRYPGKTLPAFPVEFQGEYKAKASGLKSIFYSKQFDSLRVRITSKSIDMLGEKGWEHTFTIGSKEVLSEEGRYYFLSTRDKQEPEFWNTYAMFMEGKELVLFNIAAQSNDLRHDMLKNYLPLMLLTRKDGAGSGQKTVLHLESDSSLVEASAVKEGSKDSIIYYTMNEEKLIQYIDKEKSAKNTLRFVRVKQPAEKK